MEIKYEAVFGDQSLFDDGPDDAEMVAIYALRLKRWYKLQDGECYLSTDKEQSWKRCRNGYPGFPFLAMRRIIRTPTWTKEDQKAGKLPPVGAKFLYKDEELRCRYVDSNGEIWAHDIDNKIVTPLLRDCKPIETPREKYDRERDECIDKLLAKIPPSPITVVPAMKIVYEELRPFTGGDHD